MSDDFLARFACPCCGMVNVTDRFVAAFLALERAWGRLGINSACRCAKHNKEIGGALDSRHLFGEAVDLSCPLQKRDALRAAALQAGFLGFGLGETFLHCDIGPAREWGYS